MTKRTAWLILFVLFVSSLFIVDDASAKTVNGIPDTYASEINYLINEGVIEGYPNGEFQPKKKVSRAEAATMIGRALKYTGEQVKTEFTDVGKNHFASGYIESARQAKVLEGIGNGKYAPSREMTREEMASVLARAYELTATSDIYYSDLNKDSTHHADINKITTAGISNGKGSTYDPKSFISREEFSVMVARAKNSSFRVQHQNPGKPVPVVEKMYVTAESLHLREGPGTGHKSITLLSLNTEVTIHSESGVWYEITAGKVKGYVHSGYLADQPTTDLSKFTIIIDPGHGGKDPGAIGNGINEKDLTLSVSLKVESYLKNRGVKVVMTRTGDTFPTLKQRTDLANKKKADIFVSIHANAGPPSAKGTETFHYPGSKDGKELARFIQTRLVKALDSRDRGVKNKNFHVLRETKMPAALVELGFITNKEEAQVLKTHQQAAANAVSLGIIDYLTWKDKQ